MADHNWPPSLPRFLVEGYARSGEDGVLRSQFPGGMKIRPQFTRPPPEQVTAVVVLTRAQLQMLIDFWEVTLKRVLPFNLRDHTKPDPTSVEYRFLGRPTYTPITGALWRVELRLEQMATFQGTFPLTDGAGNELLASPGGDTLTT